MSPRAPLIALVAGEASGDNLGAALIRALRERLPTAQFVGVAGPRMREAGCEALASSDELALMGLAEIITELPRLLALRRRLVTSLLERRPDVFIGIDAPEFNLRVARELKAAGIPTVQYVSPQVWAWREGRVRGIAAACDRILCLLPFEPEFYARHGVEARFVGHPLADQFPLEADRAGARSRLGFAADEQVVAILPGSRLGEVSRLAAPFAATAAWLSARRPGLRFVTPLTSAKTRSRFETEWSRVARGIPITVLEGRAGESRLALAAADVVLVASGTATLETLLSQRPMVVAYRLAALTAFLLRRFALVKVSHFAQPNLLVGKKLVPEFFQEAVTPENLGPAILDWLDHPQKVQTLRDEFLAVHRQLRCAGAGLAADAVLELLPSVGPQ